ncbi:MAG: hypothetical protein HZA28_00175 [Candidatus Omnitrophica bacterium]|nr:hypothetical protein [Candidatus Omnitrophota bacterium]
MTKRPAKLARKDAQHSLEYVILITLIMAGVILGAPYVIRSWNAQIKGWEDSVRDSMTDPLEESPDVLPSIVSCSPDPWAAVGCAMNATDSAGITWNCSATQFLQTRTYTPLNCELGIIPTPDPNTVQCLTHTCCCTAPQPTGFCGAQDNTLAGAAVDPCAGPVFDQPLNADNTCPDGTMKSWVLCGDDVDPADRRHGCMNDAACVFTCQVPAGGAPPNTLPAYGALCAGDDTRLWGNTDYTYVNAGAGNCTAATKCKIQCNPTFVPTGASCACPLGYTQYATICCPPGQTESAGVCVCAAGFAKACPDGFGGYIAGQCYQGSSCGANACEQ